MKMNPIDVLRRLAAAGTEDALPELLVAKQRLLATRLTPVECMSQVVSALNQDPLLCAGVAAVLNQILAHRHHRCLYAETGVRELAGFGGALRSRLGAIVLPHAAHGGQLRDVFVAVFKTDADANWVEAVPLKLWTDLFAMLLASPALARGREQAARECDMTIAILAARASGLACEPDRARYAQRLEASDGVEAEPLALAAAAQSWIVSYAEDATLSPKELLRVIAASEAEVRRLRAAVPLLGTSVALTRGLHASQQTLERLRKLVLVRAEADELLRAERVAALFLHLVAAQKGENSVFDWLANRHDDVALQITEHASKTGEHYVTDDRPQWWAMLRAGAGAGVIVAVMALIKVWIVKAEMAPLWEILAVCLNYGLGFVVIHLLHFTVATKQPAMTASLLAARLADEDGSPAGAARLADLIVRMVRTQVVAIVGNVALAMPTALVIFFVISQLGGVSPVPVEKAEHMLAELNPWTSWALLHAAVAGGCLFLAGVISGYYDNLCVFGRVPERIVAHPLLRRLFGSARTKRLAAYVEDNLGALMGNLAFGFLLGGVGFIGFLTGLPIDIRHVTFASANTIYGLAALDWQVSPMVMGVTVIGVVLVATVNLLVSFALAFWTAFRARKGQYARFGLLLRLVLKRLLRHPLDFVWPAPAPVPAPVPRATQ